MKYKTTVCSINYLLIIWCLILYLNVQINIVLSNPITGYDPTVAPMLSFHPIPLQAPMLMGPHYDPYASMQMPQYLYAPNPFGPSTMPTFDSDNNRRANNNNNNRKSSNNNKGNSNQQEQDMTDEQKALAGVPLSFLEPAGPTTIPERISDSFSALGEGVKNHFRSLTENFSDTIDDLKDAWRFNSSKKRNRRMSTTF